MKISIVTISFNQAKYLRRCIESVLNQNFKNIEYIVVDPGSTDGSREIIESYGSSIIKIFEKDKGPADGLNIGFSKATGDIFCYLNSDDEFIDGALALVEKYFLDKNHVDVLCGHGHVIDGGSDYKRRIFSDSFSLKAAAYGASLAIQPSTFFRKEIYRSIGGFNIENRSNWDDELLIDMALKGAEIEVVNEFLSCYRVHGESITGTGRLESMHHTHTRQMFLKIMRRPYTGYDDYFSQYYRIMKHIKNPIATFERIIHGPIFGTQK
ncbi:glycosyltransferase family 2 protein [Polaromonas naphthalenivorans]|uniref:Glycosyl transferase, family 2 n=1 Tax=Polaromonas naphthalenivorans (strain CJ2) TaxID=365044 RepID=A1VS55_POLNA|nr:glycosyltransferase family 2 protein [Polaromonas naphthalenivorans]ABM38483.1 glycosyl transferase, family 2 [Polaromonas naphthalenivorans CJ2]